MPARYSDLIPGAKMSKEWRKKVIGEGKNMGGATSSKVEKWQRLCLEKIVKQKVAKTNLRLNHSTKKLEVVPRPSTRPDEFEWTEDFDGEFYIGKTRYLVNFKMIVGAGGAQTRSLREVYHFIKCQEAHVKKFNVHMKDTKFLNILDGDTLGNKMAAMRLAQTKATVSQIYIGDTHALKKSWPF